MTIPDSILVQQTMSGRKEAFSELVMRHQNAVFNLAVQMTRNHAEAADVAQEAFVRAYRKLGYYKPEYAFGTWVMSICANLAKNGFRSEARRRVAEEAHLDLERAAEPVPPNARGEVLRRALFKLPEQERIPLTLKHMEGLSYGEIAAILRIGISAAKMRVKRAREELVRLLTTEAEIIL